MNGNRFLDYTLGILAMGLLGSAGCVSLDQVPGLALRPTAADQDAPRLSKQQAADVHLALGRSLEKRGDLDQAIAAYQEAEKRDSKRVDAYARLAVLYDHQGKFEESAAQYREALKLEPNNPEIHCDLGYSLYLQRRWAEAATDLRKALRIKPDLPRAHNNLALVLARTNRLDEALAHFRQGGCSAAQAHVNLAFALTLDRRWQDARQQYQNALVSDPSLESARKGLRDLEALMSNPMAGQAPAGPKDSRPVASDVRVKLADPVDMAPNSCDTQTSSRLGQSE
jgi:Flp pilus assembly protein TadD